VRKSSVVAHPDAAAGAGAVAGAGVGAATDPVQVTITLQPAGAPAGGYVASAQVGGRPPVAGTFQLPAYDWNQESARVGTEPDGGAGTDAAADAGMRLFDALFAGALRRCWAQAVEDSKGRGMRLVVSSADLTVHGLPWELLYDRVLVNRQLLLVDGWSVLRAVPAPPRPPEPLGSTGELGVLVVTARVAGVDNEADLAALREVWPAASVEARHGQGTADVAAALRARRVDVLHVAAGGVELPDGRQYVALGDASGTDPMAVVVLVSATELLEMFDAARRPRLVVLAGSDTDVLAAELARVVPAVVGIRGSVSEKGCAAFLHAFYRALGDGESFERALAAGRAQQRAFASALRAEWAAPVGFLPAGRLVAPAEPSGAPPPPRAPMAASATLTAPADESPVGRAAVELEIYTRDRDALLAQWGLVDGQLWPELVTRHRAELDTRLAEAARRLGGSP